MLLVNSANTLICQKALAILSTEPNHPYANLVIAKLCLHQGNYTGAIVCAKNFLNSGLKQADHSQAFLDANKILIEAYFRKNDPTWKPLLEQMIHSHAILSGTDEGQSFVNIPSANEKARSILEAESRGIEVTVHENSTYEAIKVLIEATPNIQICDEARFVYYMIILDNLKNKNYETVIALSLKILEVGFLENVEYGLSAHAYLALNQLNDFDLLRFNGHLSQLEAKDDGLKTLLNILEDARHKYANGNVPRRL